MSYRKLLLVFIFCLSFACTKKSENGAKNESPKEPNTEITLATQLQEKADQSATKTPAEIKKIMSDAITDLKQSQIMKSALKKGAQTPNFTLSDPINGSIDISQLLKKGPLIITFYRGGWCPYCNLQLRDLQKHLAAIKETGAELVAISPEKPDSTLETVKKQKLNYYVLSDTNGEVSKKFGISYEMGQPLIELYKKFGIDVASTNDTKKWELPLGATYIVNTQGKIVYSFVDADYKKRAETTDLIRILKTL